MPKYLVVINGKVLKVVLVITRNNLLKSELILFACFISTGFRYIVNCVRERVHSEMKISLIKKGILVIVPIRFISFRLFYFS